MRSIAFTASAAADMGSLRIVMGTVPAAAATDWWVPLRGGQGSPGVGTGEVLGGIDACAIAEQGIGHRREDSDCKRYHQLNK
jgi:hypothetical protein